MNDIRFSCPQCGQQLTVAASGANRTVACPQCGQAIIVPPLARLAKREPQKQRKWLQVATGIVVVALLATGLLTWQKHHPFATQTKSTHAKTSGSQEVSKPTWISQEVPKPDSDGWITLFDAGHLHGCDPMESCFRSGKVYIQNGSLWVDSTVVPFQLKGHEAALRVRAKKVSGGDFHINFGRDGAEFYGGNSFSITRHTDHTVRLQTGKSGAGFNDFLEMEFLSSGGKLMLVANKKTVVTAQDEESKDAQEIMVGAYRGISVFQHIEVKLSGVQTLFPEEKAAAAAISDEEFMQEAEKLKTVQNAPDRPVLEKQIADYRKQVKQYKTGSVIVGRIVLDGPGNPQEVIAQMEILPNGTFAGDVKDLNHPIGFRMHGYAPLDFDLAGKSGYLIDLGTIHLNRLPPEALASLTGRLALEDDTSTTAAQVGLTISEPQPNTPSDGYSGRSRWPAPISARVEANGNFRAGGFSPTSYDCVIQARGYIQQILNVDFSTNRAVDLGLVKLERPRDVGISYLVADKPPFDLTQEKRATIPGGDHLKTSPHPYAWDLNFNQAGGKIYFGTSYGPARLSDLGEGDLRDYVTTAEAPNSFHSMEAQIGHVYLLKQGFLNHWVLFKVESIGADTSPQAVAQAKVTERKKMSAEAALKSNQDEAAKGDAYGMMRMGERYRDGDGVEKDLAKAKEYLQKAADAGSPIAAEELSKLKQ